MKLEQRIQAYISNQQMLADTDRVLVALSGGADSVALLRILLRLGYHCHAVHCNFHLRGAESDRDEQFVTDLCSRLRRIPPTPPIKKAVGFCLLLFCIKKFLKKY